MTISLPALPRMTAVSPRLLDFGGTLTPPLGGPEQRILRLGSRFEVDVELPQMDEDCAMAWIAARLAAITTGATLIMTMPQHGGPTGITGSGSVGATAVSFSGGTPAVGKLFSFVAGGRNYLHQVTGAGQVAPRLRAACSGSCDFASPKLEGFLTGGDAGWDMKHLRWIGQRFSLRENK